MFRPARVGQCIRGLSSKLVKRFVPFNQFLFAIRSLTRSAAYVALVMALAAGALLGALSSGLTVALIGSGLILAAFAIATAMASGARPAASLAQSDLPNAQAKRPLEKEQEVAEAEISPQERVLLERLNIATETAGIDVWEWDVESDRFISNAHMAPEFGKSRVDVPSARALIMRIVHPEDIPGYLAAIDLAVASGPTLAHRYRMILPDGSLRHVQVQARVLRDAAGKAVRILGTSQNKTSEVEHLAELHRQASEERVLRDRLDLATQTARISVWDQDMRSGKFVADERFKELLGIDKSINRFRLQDTIHPEGREAALAPIYAAFNDPTQTQISLRHRTNNTQRAFQYVQTHIRVFRDEVGVTIRILGVTWDVTAEVLDAKELERKTAQERALITRLNVATTAAGISPWEFDLKSRRFSWHGPRPAFLGLDDVPEEDYHKTIRALVVPEDLHLWHTVPAMAIEKGLDSFDFCLRLRGVDGAIHHMQNYVHIMRTARGNIRFLVGVAWDVTATVKANQLLEARAEENRQLIERLKMATESAAIGSWDIDLVTQRFLSVDNPVRSVGSEFDSLEEFVKRVLPEDRSLLADNIYQALANNTDRVAFRYRATGVDGSIVHIQTYGRVIVNEQRVPILALGVSWDITTEVETAAWLQIQAEKERQLLERLSMATDSAGICTWEIDLLTREFLLIENPLKSMARPATKSMSITFFAERIVAEDRTMMIDAMRAARAQQSDRISYVYRAHGVEAEQIVYIKSFARLILNEGGRVVRVLGVSWDITKEMEAAAQLRSQTERLVAAERRLERASLSSSEGHWEAQLGNGHLWCSSSFHTLLGYGAGELDARVSALDYLVHPEEREAYHQALSGHVHSNVPFNIDTRLRMGHGEYRWFRMRGMVERNAQDQSIVMAGSIQDIHQQKLIEDALELAQQRFERAIHGTQDGLWELETAGDSTWCSPRLALLLGYSVAQLETGNFYRSLAHPEDAPRVASVTLAHYKHNAPFDLELRLKTRAGEYRWYRARATAERDQNGRALRLSGSLQDVTEARAAREELVRATEAAEAASRAKSAFLANVSHEIRTPMNGIIGMTGLLLDTQLDRTQRDYANTVRGSADSLLTVINDVLDFSKIEAGKLDLENIELDLRVNVEEVGAMMAFQAASKGLELIINVHPEVPERVMGDPQRLRQCLINLVGNAIKFTKRGEIVVDVCAVGRHDGWVLTHFEVRDTGMGIPEETLKTLFQPFVQADSSTTRHFGGTGLGLSIVRRLVEMMGGQVGVVSELGQGSNFFFTLSLEPKEDATPTPLTRNPPSGSRILIVDDNNTNRRVLETLLTHQGYRVTSAHSGDDALERLRAGERVDMVITDYQMPDMDGLKLGELIMSDPALTHLRLVMLTSLDGQGDSKRLAALGFAAYLTKPVRTRELLDCVAHVLSGEARQWQMEMRPMITRNTLSQASAQQRFRGHVLLVEDNVVNQKVAARFLERMGCTVQIAEHGAEGVAAFHEESFDIVFMDLQMPVMDGLTATQKVRELESADPKRRRTPIVALTANAMRSDQERCEAAGMDGYLTKPIEIERLRDTLIKFGLIAVEEMPRSWGEPPTTVQRTGASQAAPINLARLNEITDGDAEFAKELVETFIVSGEQQLAEMHAALVAADRVALARVAHKLKGACGNIHADALHTLAAQLEAEAPTASEADLQNYTALLQQQFAHAKEFLTDPAVVPPIIRAAS